MIDTFRPGAEVSLKVNLGWDILIPGAISAPWVVEGVIRAIRGYVGRIYLVESDQSIRISSIPTIGQYLEALTWVEKRLVSYLNGSAPNEETDT